MYVCVLPTNRFTSSGCSQLLRVLSQMGLDNVKMRLDLPQKTKQNVVNSSRFKIIEALAKNYYVIVVKK